MKKRLIAAAVVSALAIAGLAMPSLAADDATQMYTPQVGDEVVVYTHVFRPEHYDEAARIVTEEFHGAMDDSGQTRYTAFIANPSTYEIVAVSFFADGESVEEWQEFAARLEVLEKLEPMRQEPMVVKRYETLSISSTD